MKKSKYFIILFICMLLPKEVFAYQFLCDKNVIDYNKNLFCHLSGQPNQDYDFFSGNISSTDNLIDCKMVSYGSGLSKIDDLTSFNLRGTTPDETIATFSCYLSEKLSETKRLQIKIDDFKYKISNEKEEISNEILSSDFISANIYKEEVETDDKPRNTSNPNSLLKSLSGENLNLTFSRFVTIYNLEVLYEVEKLNLNLIPNNSEAKIRIVGNEIENNTALNIGENVIDIYVTDLDGNTTCYTLNITRLAQGEKIYYPESDATLFSLIVPGYAISFNKNTYEYKIHLASDISKLNVSAVPTYDEADVNISSTENLRNGSIIKISVTSKDKSNTAEYIIKISKDAPKSNYTPYIVLGLTGITLIILIVLFIKTSQKKKNKNSINKLNSIDNRESPNSNNTMVSITEENTNNIDNYSRTNNSNTTNIPNDLNNVSKDSIYYNSQSETIRNDQIIIDNKKNDQL